MPGLGGEETVDDVTSTNSTEVLILLGLLEDEGHVLGSTGVAQVLQYHVVPSSVNGGLGTTKDMLWVG